MTESICILRLSALGDVTHVLPVVRAIQDQRPQASISWVIGQFEQRLVPNLEGVELIPFDKKGGWAAFIDLRRALAKRRFDTLLHMQVAARANLVSTTIRARRRIGWDRARSRDGHQWFVNERVAEVPFQHQVDGFLEFATALGLESRQPRWDLPVDESARDWAAQQLDSTERWLAISPCSSHSLRNWAPDRYAAIADHAAKQLGMRVVLMGGPSEIERTMGQAIEHCAGEPLLNLIGRDTLPQSVALLDAVDLLVSPDAGPAHMASALGTPVIGLYAATWSRRSGPYNSLDLCVDRFTEAAEQYRNKRPEDLRWGTRIEQSGVMDLVAVDDVIAVLESWHRDQSV